MAEYWSTLRRWLLPGVSLAIFAAVVYFAHRELTSFRLEQVLAQLRAVPLSAVAAALACTALSYWLLGFYDVLALRYLERAVPYTRALFTSFIAYAFGHNLGVAAFTSSAVRYRLYAAVGLGAADVAAIAAFCTVTTAIGLAALAGVAFLVAPQLAGAQWHLHALVVRFAGAALLAAIAGYALWSAFGPRQVEIRGWSLRTPTGSASFWRSRGRAA